jgi:eukaryotic-like serine/threonine-protein kinase
VVAVVLLVAAALVGGGAWALVSDDDEPRAATQAQDDDTSTDAEENPPASTPDTTGTTEATTTSTAAPESDVPEGWTLYQDPAGGYTIAHPQGWQVESAGGPRIDIKDPETGSYLRIDWTATPGDDPVADWREQSGGFASRHQGYQEIQIAPYQYRDYNAGMWEFRYQDGGAQLHVANLGFVTGGRGYALYFQTQEGRWDQSQDIYDSFRASFQPAP